MSAASRRGFTLIELLIATSIVGILTGIAIPTFVAVRQAALAQKALTALRAVDIAVNSSCGRGTCGPFTDSAAVSSVMTRVPAALKEFLPAGFVFAGDTATYALQLESWSVAANPVTPVCVPTCGGGKGKGNGNNGNGNNGNGNNGNGNNGNGNGSGGSSAPPEDPGFTNTAGFAAPPTVYVTVSILTKDGNVAQALYKKAGGTPPVFITNGKVWKYSYPVLVAVPATG